MADGRHRPREALQGISAFVVEKGDPGVSFQWIVMARNLPGTRGSAR